MLDSRNEPGWANQRRLKGDCDCNQAGQLNEGCCSGSRLRDPGIKRTNIPGVYFADADLECSGSNCRGSDNDTVYEWILLPISGDTRITSPTTRVGNDRVQVEGTGSFYLHVRVTFKCTEVVDIEVPIINTECCIRDATVRFTQ